MDYRRARLQVEKPEEGNLTYEIEHIPWKKRLQELQSRWVENTPENAAAYLAQINEAWSAAYTCIWNKPGAYTDDERNDAARHMGTALRRYDPSKNNLLKYVESQAGLLLKTAYTRGMDIEYDAPYGVADTEKWHAELAEYQQTADGTPEWAEDVCGGICAHYADRLAGKFSKKDERRQAKAALFNELKRFQPQSVSLQELVENWVKQTLGGEKKPHERKGAVGTSLDTPIGEEGETTIGEMLPSPDVGPRKHLEDSEEYSVILMAMVASYQIALGDKNLKARTRYCRLNYTEQLSCFGQQLNLPQIHSQDLLKPLDPDYFRYFMYTGNAKEITLRTIAKAKLLPVVGEGPYLLVKPKWDKYGFLPANAQIGYLKSRGISSSDSTVSGHRKGYKAGFLADLRSRL